MTTSINMCNLTSSDFEDIKKLVCHSDFAEACMESDIMEEFENMPNLIEMLQKNGHLDRDDLGYHTLESVLTNNGYLHETIYVSGHECVILNMAHFMSISILEDIEGQERVGQHVEKTAMIICDTWLTDKHEWSSDKLSVEIKLHGDITPSVFRDVLKKMDFGVQMSLGWPTTCEDAEIRYCMVSTGHEHPLMVSFHWRTRTIVVQAWEG